MADRLVISRTWEDCIEHIALENDGFPRLTLLQLSDDGIIENRANDIEIEMHDHLKTLFEEVDPYQITRAPSHAPSEASSSQPSNSPSADPTKPPSLSPTTSLPPSAALTKQPSKTPTKQPTFSAASVPINTKPGYFNYDPSSEYGPRHWKNIEIDQSNPGFFHEEFDLIDERSNISNDCGSGERQSPIDVCTSPKDSCLETHEMRPKPGDYTMTGNLIKKQILPSMLRLVMEPRTGDEPDPPQIDFSSNGQGIQDMTNIDFKFPSEHTVCGQRFDGEMQYYTFHPNRKRLVAVAFFLDASEGNPTNNHLQEVIDAFTLEFEKNKKKCEQKQQGGSAASFVNGRRLDTINNEDGSRSQNNRLLASSWYPFDPEIQKTVHFWGYSGSLTEPPCTKNIIDWKVMDVPTPISLKQLQQFKSLLFDHVDENCERTSVNNAEGSVARPTQPTSKYYKCTRDNYVSDEERMVCGYSGCIFPFGEGLNPYYPPLVEVTGPPTPSPTTG